MYKQGIATMAASGKEKKATAKGNRTAMMIRGPITAFRLIPRITHCIDHRSAI
jgi:hypothetical protein